MSAVANPCQRIIEQIKGMDPDRLYWSMGLFHKSGVNPYPDCAVLFTTEEHAKRVRAVTLLSNESVYDILHEVRQLTREEANAIYGALGVTFICVFSSTGDVVEHWKVTP